MQMPAVPLVCYLDGDAAASNARENFSAAEPGETGSVLPNFFVREHRKVFLRQNQVLRRADFLPPEFDYFLPLSGDSELAAWTPFDVATVREFFELAATFARPKYFLVTAPAEIPELRGGVKSVEVGTDGFVEVIVFVCEFQLPVFALSSGDGSGPDEGA
jgi:hypothetical protein